MKIGDTIRMRFDCFGVTSFEDVTVIKFDETTITVDNEKVFDRKTGKCLNDNVYMGGKRSIKPQ